MGLNSTDTAWGYGQFGSSYLTGDGAILDLDGATAKYYVVAISFITATKFQALNILDGGVGLGMSKTHFVSTEDTQTLDTDWGAVTNAGDDDGRPLTPGGSCVEFPAGMTIYGAWDYVELHAGDVICYVAPRPDYRKRAAAI